MLLFIAWNGVVEVSGVWGCGGDIAASACQYIRHKGGDSPASPPCPGAARTASPWVPGAGGGWLRPLQGGHRGARAEGRGRLLRECGGGSRKPAGQVLHLNRILIGRRATCEGGGRRKSTAISRPQGGALPVSQLGEMRHRGEGSPLAGPGGHRQGGGGNVGGRKVMRGDSRSPPV